MQEISVENIDEEPLEEGAPNAEAVMTSTTGKAAKPNLALAPLARLIGRWTTAGTHPMIPDTVLHGRATFEWIEGGAFLRMQTENDDQRIPAGIAIIGSDDAAGEFSMLYFDVRGVSRLYHVSIEGDVWRWWRDAPGFSQRYSCKIAADAQTMVGKGELSKDGSTWEGDLNLTYTRVG
jgi:hypothetical protein